MSSLICITVNKHKKLSYHWQTVRCV